jgi:hypothetical protein
MQLILTEVIATQMTLHRWDLSSSNRSLLQVEDIIELLNIYLKTMHFQFQCKFNHSV